MQVADEAVRQALPKPYYDDGGATIHHGDCRTVMAALPSDSIDTIITDPPYALTNRVIDAARCAECKWTGGGATRFNKAGTPCPRCGAMLVGERAYRGNGFMGKEWDNGLVAFDPATWAAALRIAKPGAMLLAFGGTRTFHRLTCAIEDAGWEIRDCMSWLYGCLSEDTEILVDGRWEPYHKAMEGSRVLAYNPGDETFSWQTVERLYVYVYDDTAYRIESAYTDQIVSRNHRCLVEQEGGGYRFQLAEEAAREREIRVPVLEDVQGVLDTVPVPYASAGNLQKDVLASVRGDNGGEISARASEAEHCMCGLPEAIPFGGVTDSAGEGSNVLEALQRSPARTGLGKAWSQGTCCVERGLTSIISPEDERSQQPGVEGRSDDLSQARQLQGSSLRSMSGAIQIDDGEERRLRDGASAGGCEVAGAMPAEVRGCSSRRSQAGQQQSHEPDAVSLQPRSQAVRTPRHTRTDLARITPFHYRGVVWCVKVATGAFVARRNGKVFVTGNSGFPKSLDISKAIDKAAGAVRETGRVDSSRAGRLINQSEDYVTNAGWSAGNRKVTIDPPATDAAKEWDGWGTALKPAWEPIIVAMKPLDGTFAENALRHGVAGLNIDGARIGTDSTERNQNAGPTWSGEYKGGERINGSSSGRWPANVVLDGDAAELLDQMSGERVSGAWPASRGAGGISTSGHKGQECGERREGNAGGASRFFYTAKASRSERGRDNNHPTVKPLDLMKYLCRLTATPTGGIVLDPFMGSGTTLRAALDESRKAIGIEQSAEYCELAKQRLAQSTLFVERESA